MEPRDELADALDQLATDQSVAVNIYDAPPSAPLETPALVVRPDEPWRRPGGAPFPHIAERYAVVAVVLAAGDMPSNVDKLRQLALLVEAVQDASSSWKWTETSGIAQVAQDGIDYLGVTVRMEYQEG